jgi:hypothetical protein
MPVFQRVLRHGRARVIAEWRDMDRESDRALPSGPHRLRSSADVMPVIVRQSSRQASVGAPRRFPTRGGRGDAW